MMHILGLDHVVLRVQEMNRVMRFYRDVLGCSVERVREDLGLVQLRAGQSLIDLVAVDGEIGKKGGVAPGAEGRNMDHLCLRIEPFDQAALTSHLVGHGFLPGEVGMRYGADGFGQSVYVSDPEGNVVELKGPPDSGYRERRVR
ncbi:MAG TPA: VOC family protein [Burkholderiales bacterium]|jgi:catechol 2,3-dioxygenase-like lactoylglutathione lyase family enzyme|nr:VOC family protein [Burkholderiales bacterium]